MPASVSPVAAQEAHDPQEHADDPEHDDEPAELDSIVVESTRSRRRVSEEPIRVEVIVQEEIEEKRLMTPGSSALLVAETPGVRVQSTSRALGASNVRIRGLRGRYTQLLADGLPLYGGQASSIGLLQIPPTDLGRVEIIKGAASALYGPSALGGVIDLISRRPRDEREGELLLNATTRDGQDLTAYAASPLSASWSASLVGGHHRQGDQDLDDDGWVDMPAFRRSTLRPRLFWTGADGAKALLTLDAMDEDRAGGTRRGRLMPDGRPFPLTQDTRRLDGGAVVELPVGDAARLHLRASAMDTRHRHRFGDIVEDDRHRTAFFEASYGSVAGETSWLAGAALQSDRYRSQAFPAFDYRHTVPRCSSRPNTRCATTSPSPAARWDDHSADGSDVSPRLSLLYRPGDRTIRASIGRGFHAPTPFVEEIEAAGLSHLEPTPGLLPETATTGSLDLGYAVGPLEASLSLFASDIRNAVRLLDAPDGTPRVRLANADGSTRAQGAELLMRYRWDDVVLTGSYVLTDATEADAGAGGRRRIPLTPRHAGGVVAMWERHGRGRLGIEAYYTGTQPLDDDPYRRRGRPYVELGILGEITLGRASLFLDLENILDVRQTRYQPLTRPQRANDGRWTVDAWAPPDGFVVNGGVRFRF